MALHKRRLLSTPKNTKILDFFGISHLSEGRGTTSKEPEEANTKSAPSHHRTKLHPMFNRLKRSNKFGEHLSTAEIISVSESSSSCEDVILVSAKGTCSVNASSDNVRSTTSRCQKVLVGDSRERQHVQEENPNSASRCNSAKLSLKKVPILSPKNPTSPQLHFLSTTQHFVSSANGLVTDKSSDDAQVLWGSHKVSGFQGIAKPTSTGFRSGFEVHRSGWREDFSDEIHQDLLEEIQTINPKFPVHRFSSMLLRKRKLQEQEWSKRDGGKTYFASPAGPVNGKRKLEDQKTIKSPKRQRVAHQQEEEGMVAVCGEAGLSLEISIRPPAKFTSRLSRTRRKRQQSRSSHVMQERIQCQTADSPQGLSKKDGVEGEDVLWTEKYQPQHSSEVIGNSVAMNRLHSWLKEWKVRADREEMRQRRERRQERNSNGPWDCGDFEGEARMGEQQEVLCNTLMITGPTGVGKTAAVYACAEELGFKVFEVNSSAQRSGHLILTQLKEATQSHLIDTQRASTLKPKFISNHCSTLAKPATSLTEVTGRRSSCPSRKLAPCRRGRSGKDRGTSGVTLKDFFMMSDRAVYKTPDGPHRPRFDANTVEADTVKETLKASSVETVTDSEVSQSAWHSKTATTSLILFEEVDIIFSDDVGFLTAIKTFMSTTKRPVILTTSDPRFSGTFDGRFEELHFKTPSMASIRSYLMVLCVVEKVRVDPADITALVSLNDGDVRWSILQLQLWVRSGGGRQEHRPFKCSPSPHVPSAAAAATRDEMMEASTTKKEKTPERHLLAELPLCDTGCTENVLGFESKHYLKTVLKRTSWSVMESSRCLEVLAERCRLGHNLLYSNMEVLFALPTKLPPCSAQNQHAASCRTSHDQPTADILPQNHKPLEQAVWTSKLCRRGLRKGLPLKNSCPSTYPSMDNRVFSLAESHVLPFSSERFHQSHCESEGSSAESRLSGLVSGCLGSLAEFFENMSYLDSYIRDRTAQLPGPCRPGPPGWVGAELQDSLLDMPREEEKTRCWQSLSAMQAMVEGLAFHRCHGAMSEARSAVMATELGTGAQAGLEDKFSIPVPPHRRDFSFCQSSPIDPSVVCQREKVVRGLLSRGAVGCLWNKPAMATDYLPTLRSICRSEKAKEQSKRKCRFLHYLRRINLHLPKTIFHQLGTDFP